MTKMIRVQNLKKTFKVHKKQAGIKASLKSLFKRQWIEKHALKGVNLEVKEGEILGLIGSNGAGKTTLVKILSGIIHPTSGEVDVLGYNPWKRQNEFRKKISLIMGQKAQLWWDLPAMDCFLLLREIYQIDKKEYQKRIDQLKQALDIDEQLFIPIRRLSLGERMKVELMASLLHRPKIVFLDEPTIGLDLSAQKNIRQFLLDYQAEFKPCMILTSHYMEDIESLCQRIALIRQGEFIYDGSLSDVTEKYAVQKKINLTIKNKKNIDKVIQTFPKELGEANLGSNGIEITVGRPQVNRALHYLTDNFIIDDLKLEEVDIGDIIEKMMKGMHEPRPVSRNFFYGIT